VDEKSIIQGTIEDVKKSIVVLEDQREELDARIAEARKRLEYWQARVGSASEKPGRAVRGSILRAIKVAFEGSIEKSIPLAELAKSTGFRQSSVRSALIRGKAKFENGLWFAPEKWPDEKEDD
jgi:hypothetical protein